VLALPVLLLAACNLGAPAEATAPEVAPPAPSTDAPVAAGAKAVPAKKSVTEPGAPKALAIYFQVQNRGEIDPCG